MPCKAILIVEDEAEIRENLATLLEFEGFSVFQASNGKEGLERLREIPRPCLILLDLLMPVMNGIEFLQAKGSDDLIATIPVGVVSGVAEKPIVNGAVHFLRKPFEFDGLLKFIQKYCDQKAGASC